MKGQHDMNVIVTELRKQQPPPSEVDIGVVLDRISTLERVPQIHANSAANTPQTVHTNIIQPNNSANQQPPNIETPPAANSANQPDNSAATPPAGSANQQPPIQPNNSATATQPPPSQAPPTQEELRTRAFAEVDDLYRSRPPWQHQEPCARPNTRIGCCWNYSAAARQAAD